VHRGNPAPPGTHTAEAVVDLSAIGHNIAVIAAHTTSAVMAVVKADGFGHGLVPAADAALTHGATWLGVTSAAEALALRAAAIDAPTLTWLHGPDEDFGQLIAADIDISAVSPDQLDRIAAAAAEQGIPAHVHLKVDTGMSRNGAAPAEWPHLVATARAFEDQNLLRVRGVWTHLANADHPDDPSVTQQLRAFDGAAAIADAAGLRPDLRHVANSAAALAIPAAHYDMVRVGVACYGVEPIAGRTHGLRPAMTLRARVIMVRRVPAGTGVSYHHDYTTTRDTTLVLVPLGYADGVPRHASATGEVWSHGRRCPVAGLVSMDQFVVDVGDAPVSVGDDIVLFGPGDDGEPTILDWATWAGTNPHEILTHIGPRVPRRYVETQSLRAISAETKLPPETKMSPETKEYAHA
jgi:alanine racemase